WALGAARRRVRTQLAALRDRSAAPRAPSGGREAPPIRDYRAQLAALVERGVKIFAVYSGIHGAGYNHEDQLFELFPELRGKVDRAYFPDANHTFTDLAQQAKLVEAVTGWITSRFR
ncbi:MAG TPA: hypothetical protein VK427_24465, partial [Kofleriaceae bacterium]|nr:hypothetical protein [Kofleriaceae bacterium]